MRIKDRPEFRSKPTPLTCSPETSVREAVRQMAARNFGAMIVTDSDSRVTGMMTERDVLKRLVDEERNPDTTTVKDIMTTGIRVAREDDRVVDWLRMMSNERFRRVPVVDGEDRLISIMTQGDFVSYTWPDLLRQTKEFAQSTVSRNYQVFMILGGVMIYTLLILTLTGAV